MFRIAATTIGITTAALLTTKMAGCTGNPQTKYDWSQEDWQKASDAAVQGIKKNIVESEEELTKIIDQLLGGVKSIDIKYHGSTDMTEVNIIIRERVTDVIEGVKEMEHSIKQTINSNTECETMCAKLASVSDLIDCEACVTRCNLLKSTVGLI